MRTWLAGALLALVGLHPAVRGSEVLEVHHQNGALASREALVGGQREGLYQTWWPNGRLRSQAHYVAGAYHGEYRTWRENGRPYERRTYADGRESGVQQSWDEQGALYLNYEVRHGRRYGFVNAYPCAPATMGGLALRGGSR